MHTLTHWFKKCLPNWLLTYQKTALFDDILAGIIVGVLVIPQSLGYALLAGLPPVYGLYAAIVPVLVYGWFGSNSTVAVGPVAITAIMTAQTLLPYSHNPSLYISLALLLAFLSGAILLLASWLKLGWIMQFISRGVTAGFISGAAMLIFISQLKYITGIPIKGNTLITSVQSLIQQADLWHKPTFMLGTLLFVVLIINRFGLKAWLIKLFSHTTANMLVRLIPLVLVITATAISYYNAFNQQGIATIGYFAGNLPQLQSPFTGQQLQDLNMVINLLPSALLIALIGFVSSSSVAIQFCRLRKEPFNANQELKSLGWANVIGAFFQSFPITGGFSRTAVNVDAGGKTPLAGIIAALIMLLALVLLNQLLAPMPYAVLGASIMAAVISLVDFDTFKQAKRADPIDAISFLVTLIAVLTLGLNIGLVAGLLFSFAARIWQSSQPHIAIIGQIDDTGHFRNICRHNVRTFNDILLMRIDESLYFGNANSVRQHIDTALLDKPMATHLVLVLSGVNHIDLTAQDMLKTLNEDLANQRKQLHFAEVKGPVMDKIGQTPLIKHLSGQVFLSTLKAVDTLQTKHLPEYML